MVPGTNPPQRRNPWRNIDMAGRRTRITKSFTFDAAHWLPRVADDHKCRRLHGHTYRIEVALEGELDPELGWVVDYGEVSRVVDPIVRELDHRCLNDLPGLENPTAEILAAWLFERLCTALPQLVEVMVCETPRTAAIHRLED
jgi:6-pyruvoyltetrahydropterin/6-carboxytetrahydropterin synthase